MKTQALKTQENWQALKPQGLGSCFHCWLLQLKTQSELNHKLGFTAEIEMEKLFWGLRGSPIPHISHALQFVCASLNLLGEKWNIGNRELQSWFSDWTTAIKTKSTQSKASVFLEAFFFLPTTSISHLQGKYKETFKITEWGINNRNAHFWCTVVLFRCVQSALKIALLYAAWLC